MKFFFPIHHHYIAFSFLCFSLLSVACNDSEKNKTSSKPVKIHNPVKERNLTTLTLSSKAVERLGIKTAKAKNQKIQDYRTLGGDCIVPAGQSIIVSSPVAGTLLSSLENPVSIAGHRLEKNQVIFKLLVLPSDGDLISATHQITEQKALLQLAQAKAERAKKLLSAKLGSQELYDNALVIVAKQKAGVQIALNRLKILDKTTINSNNKNLATLQIDSPSSGILQKVFALPGQTVASGTPLFEITKIAPLWVRVPIYPGDLSTFDLDTEIKITALGSKDSMQQFLVTPIQAPPSANPDSASIDLYFKLNNTNNRFQPGERVSIILPIRSTEKTNAIPYSAIVYDIHGGTWVYVKTAENTFVRHRIELKSIVSDTVFYTRGPTTGTEIVISGTAELFGSEFGSGK